MSFDKLIDISSNILHNITLDDIFLPIIALLIALNFLPKKTAKHPKFNKEKLAIWSRAVRKRDKYKCVVCDSKLHTEAHHIMSKSKYPKYAYEVKNGITLCRKCHRTGVFAYHKIMGQTSNKFKFIAWLWFRKSIDTLIKIIVPLLIIVALVIYAKVYYNQF